jgi:hypothetical protein
MLLDLENIEQIEWVVNKRRRTLKIELTDSFVHRQSWTGGSVQAPLYELYFRDDITLSVREDEKGHQKYRDVVGADMSENSLQLLESITDPDLNDDTTENILVFLDSVRETCNEPLIIELIDKIFQFNIS